jgi:glutamine synthetase
MTLATRDERAAATLERLEALDATALWVVYHDYAGLGRAKAVPHGRFGDVAHEGVTFAMANWDLAITDHQVPHPVFGADSGDFRAVPDPRSIVAVPHRPGVAQAFARLTDDLGEPWAGDPRALLERQVDRLTALGIGVSCAFEAEFVLVAASEGPGALLHDRSRMFTVDELDARWPVGERYLDGLDRAGVRVHQLAKEYGPGQFEVSLLPRAPLPAVDEWLLARQFAKAVAREQGLVASFMPKPFTDLPGNGLHVHLGLYGTRQDGTELVGDPDDDRRLAPTGASAVAGLLAHAAGQTALGPPSPTSPKRLQPGSWAPAHVAWGHGNRAALVRIPGRGRPRHLEYRSGDATANPYLHLTGLLAAIADGIERSLDVLPEADLDVGHLSDGAAAAAGHPRLPDHLSAALDALEADPVLLDALGPVVPEHYLAVKRFEVASYLAESGAAETDLEVTDWERTVYFDHV